MNEPENNSSSPVRSESKGLVKVARSLQISDKIITRSNQREFELERARLDTVRIGEQEWMAKNLDIAHFRNGDPIPEIRDNKAWAHACQNGEPAWCYYDNDPKNGKIFGKLYNWYAVNDERGLIPEGWRWPTDADWVQLELEVWPKNTSWPSNSFAHSRGSDRYAVEKGGSEIDIATAMKNAGFSPVGCGTRSSYSGYFKREEHCWWQNHGKMIIWFYLYGRDLYKTIDMYLRYFNQQGGESFTGAVKCIRDHS